MERNRTRGVALDFRREDVVVDDAAVAPEELTDDALALDHLLQLYHEVTDRQPGVIVDDGHREGCKVGALIKDGDAARLDKMLAC